MLIEFTTSNQLTGSTLPGPHVKAHDQLKDEDKSTEAITDAFLTIFAEVVKPHWNLLAPYIISYNYEVTEENTLQQLQTWKEKTSLTYGGLNEILSQLIINPVVIPQDIIIKGSLRCIHKYEEYLLTQYTHVFLQMKIFLVKVKI